MTFDHGAWAGGPGAVEGFHPGRLDGVVTFQHGGDLPELLLPSLRHGSTLLDPATLGRPLPAGLRVETFLGSPPYTVFDAWFHWTD
ncbi:hypothetical protein [Nonomuraea salmonea]|uniref:Uncharacterized protein n=1 Tax=Nonomuraea salmonea TaxID=46181 RepID=A0ABV5P3E3_9ACTN